MLRVCKNAMGFSLIEVMIVASIMLIISLGVARFITNQGRQISVMEDRISRVQLEQELMTLFNQRSLCQNILGQVRIAKNEDPLPIKIQSDTGRVIFDPKLEDNQYDYLRVVSANVINRSVKAANSLGEVEVLVGLERLRQGGAPQEMVPISFRVPVVVDNVSVVKSCYPKRTPICGDSIILRSGQLPDPNKDFRNCCPGGGALSDCVTTGLEQVSAGNSIFFICTCD